MDTTTAYDRTRLRMTAIARALPEADGDREVPCCPAWTVRQLLSHAVGVTADIVGGNVEGAGSDPWTKQQVDDRDGRSIAELCDEWDESGPKLAAALAGGLLPAQAVFDLVTHEHDLRHAIDQPGAQGDEAVPIGLGFVVDVWPVVMAAYPIPPLRIVADEAELVAGEDPEVTLALTPFETLRALTGRRSLDQVRGYRWGLDPEPWMPAFTWGPFTPSPTDLVEPVSL